jgi:hypothetical protein
MATGNAGSNREIGPALISKLSIRVGSVPGNRLITFIPDS